MAWAEVYKLEVGDRVDTPHGKGNVTANLPDGGVQVAVMGTRYNLGKDQVSKPGSQPKEGGDNDPNDPKGKQAVKMHDKVQKVGNPGTTGKVIGVNSQTITVKWDANGKVAKFPANEVGQPGNIQPKGAPVPQPDGTLQVGDKVKGIASEGYADHDEHMGDSGTVTSVGPVGIQVEWGNGDYSTYQNEQSLEKQEEKDEKPEAEKPEQKKPLTPEETGDAMYGLMKLKDYMEDKIDKDVDGELKELREQVKKTQTIEVKIGDEAKGKVEGLKHKQLEQLINYAAIRLNPLLVGMAGTGKTHAGEQVSKALGLDFYAMSVGAQTSKSDIIGYMDATGNYVKTHFRDAYEHGGIFLMDEIDAGNANVLIQVNAALSNNLCAFPDKMVQRHEDFIFIASANTYGNGASRQYVGRNQLDAATLDRFAIIDWLIDDELEKNLSSGLYANAWYMAVKAARDYVADKNIRALVSPRATQKGSRLLDIGQDLDEVIDATMLASVPEDKRPDVRQVAKTVFEKFASQVPSKLGQPTVADLIK